jgi:hypothetical protein
MTQIVRPAWLDLAQSIDGAVLDAAEQALTRRHPNIDLGMVPYAAVLHLRACCETGLWANGQGYHSAALGVLRQSIEALTLIDLGLQTPDYNSELLAAWKAGKKSHGEIRKALERDIWPRYGTGLWSESWSQFFGNLSRAIQPFAHYTPELMNWQFYIPSQRFVASGDGHFQMLQSIGRKTNDPVKAARVYLLTAMAVWTLARLLRSNDVGSTIPLDNVDALGKSIAGSKLLEKGENWGEQLMGHLFFTPG